MTGATISCSDIVPTEKVNEKIAGLIQDGENKYTISCNTFADSVEAKKKWKGGKIQDAFEVDINSKLNDVLSEANKQAVEEITFRYNNFQKMVWAGSKGKATNLAQVRKKKNNSKFTKKIIKY